MNMMVVIWQVYVWGRRNCHVQMSLLGLFTFRAPYLPWVLLCTSMLLNHHMTMSADLLGMGVGHIYYFLAFVYPKVCCCCNIDSIIVTALLSTIIISVYLFLR